MSQDARAAAEKAREQVAYGGASDSDWSAIAQAEAMIYVGDQLDRLIRLLEGGITFRRGDVDSYLSFEQAGRV